MQFWRRRSAEPNADMPVTPMDEATDIMLQLGFDPAELEHVRPGGVYFPQREGHMEAGGAIRNALEAFAIRHNVAVFASNPHGAESRPIYLPGTVHVRFWSRAGTRTERFLEGHSVRTRMPLSILGGLCGSPQRDALLGAVGGVGLTSGSETIVQIVGNTVYILLDLPHCNVHGSRCLTVQRQLTDIMQTAAIHLDMNWVEGEEVLPEANLAEQRVQFAAAATTAITQRTAHVDRELARVDRKATESALALMNATRERETLLLTRRTMLEVDQTEHLLAQFDAIVAMPEIDRVDPNSTGFAIYTQDITIVHERRSYAIGRFKVNIHFSGEMEGRIVILNRTRPQGTFPHPHVAPGGFPCLGNIEREIPNLISQGLLEELVILIISFLQSYNPASPHLKLEHWR